MSSPSTLTFGALLRQLRRRTQMTQGDLAAAVGYSVSFISSLEQNTRRPDVHSVLQHFVPALALQEEPHLATQLLELAAATQGDLPPPAAITFTRERRIVITEANIEPPTNLPMPPTALIGREQTVKTLCDRLLGHQGRLLTLVGPPGVGKTRLALQVAIHLQPFHLDGVYFVPLASVSDPDWVASALAGTLAIAESPDKSPEKQVVEFLRRKEMLLLLDNFEQVSAAAPLVATLLTECPRLRILVTSRERLHLRAEQRYPVQPLDIAAACELFVQRAQAVDPAFGLTPENQPVIAAICQRLDCLPLAVELSAVQVDLLSPMQLLAQLQAQRLDLLNEGAADLPPRQHTLRTAIDYSYRLLDEAERMLFRSCGIFVGGFDLAAVETVSNWQQTTPTRSLSATLHALINKSLVRSETWPSGEPRFLLLATIREFALEQMRAHGEEGVLRQRHYAAYLRLFRTADNHLRGPASATWLAHLEQEQENLRAALRWVFDQGGYADAAWLMIACGWFWHLRGHWYERGQWLSLLVPHRQALHVDLRLATLSTVYSTVRSWEAFQPLDRYTNELMQLLELSSNKLLQATGWFWLAIAIADASADFPQAAAAWEKSIACARAAWNEPQLGDEFCFLADRDFVLVSCIGDYATELIERGKVARAVPLLAESLAILQQRGNRYEIADALGTLGVLALVQGDLVQAHKHLHEAVISGTASNHQSMVSNWQPLLGLVTLYVGDTGEAHRLLNEGLRLCLEQKVKYLLARVCTFLAEAALWENKLDQSEQWLAQSLAYDADSHRITIYEVGRLWVAARLATTQQQHRRAATLFGLAEQMHSQIHSVIAGPMRSLAEAALATVRTTLEPAAFAEAFTAGQQMSLAEPLFMGKDHQKLVVRTSFLPSSVF